MPLLNSPNQDSDRRKLLAAAGLWRFSWRSSKKKLQEERDDTSTTNLTIEKKNKRVQFNPSASLLPITPSLDDTVDSNLSWYQDNDYDRFQKDRVLTSYEYSSPSTKSSFNESEHSIRGLEMYVDKKIPKRVHVEKKDLLSALRKEESNQKEMGNFPDLERFRSVSMKHTKAARERALVLGAEDAKETYGKQKFWKSRRQQTS